MVVLAPQVWVLGCGGESQNLARRYRRLRDAYGHVHALAQLLEEREDFFEGFELTARRR